MTQPEFFQALQSAQNLAEAENALTTFLSATSNTKWVPFGNRDNNRGAIEASSDPGRSIIERLTNGIDGVLEDEHHQHNGIPDCRSPKEAATAWLNVPIAGLSDMTTVERRAIARLVSIRMLNGEGRSGRVLEIRDLGIGLTSEQMPSTILSLSESNKMQKHYLAGAYGQGGSSTFASSSLTLIASRAEGSAVVAFTVIKYEDLPPDLYKIGRYGYLTLDGSVLQSEASVEEFPKGTLVKHFGYDLTTYPSPVAVLESEGNIRIELSRPGMPTLADERVFTIVERPPAKPAANRVTFPSFEVISVDGPDDDRWTGLGWPENINDIASSADMEEGKLMIYYSTVFPKFAAQRANFERRDTSLAESFRKRYEIWLIVHSLLFHQDELSREDDIDANPTDAEIERAEKLEREERTRIGLLATLFATRELQHPESAFLDIDTA